MSIKLYKDGIVMNVSSESEKNRLKNLGYKVEGEDLFESHDLELFEEEKQKFEEEKQKFEEEKQEIEHLKEENQRLEQENQKLLRQVERLKNKV